MQPLDGEILMPIRPTLGTRKISLRIGEKYEQFRRTVNGLDLDPVFIHRPRVRFAARGKRYEEEQRAKRLLDRERSIRVEGQQAAGARAIQPDSQRASSRARARAKRVAIHIIITYY